MMFSLSSLNRQARAFARHITVLPQNTKFATLSKAYSSLPVQVLRWIHFHSWALNECPLFQ